MPKIKRRVILIYILNLVLEELSKGSNTGNAKKSSSNLTVISNVKTLKAPKQTKPQSRKTGKRSTLMSNDIKSKLNVIYSPKSSKSNSKSKASKSRKSFVSKSSYMSSEKSHVSFMSHNEIVVQGNY